MSNKALALFLSTVVLYGCSTSSPNESALTGGLLEGHLTREKASFSDDERTRLELSFENVSQRLLQIRPPQVASTKHSAIRAVVEVEVTRTNGLGSSVSFNHSMEEEIPFPEEITLGPGGRWDTEYMLDLSAFELRNQDLIHVFTLRVTNVLVEIAHSGRVNSTEIAFPPAVIKWVPDRYRKFEDNPLRSLVESMKNGAVQEMFVCCQLLEGAQKGQGTDLLIALMRKAATRQARRVVSELLTLVTGKKLGQDPCLWEQWRKQQRDIEDYY